MLTPPFIARRMQSQHWLLPRLVYFLIAASLGMYSLFFLVAERAGPVLLNFQPAWAAGSGEGEKAMQATWDQIGSLPELQGGDDEHIAICAAIKEQQEDMVEWLVHHYHHMGVKRFYIMDDGSKPPLATFDYPGIPRSALTFTYQPRQDRDRHMQLVFYRWCLDRWRDRHTWIAFIDADEFLYTPGPESFPEILASFEGNDTVGALGVSWQAHTSNGLLERPDSVRKAFTECVANNGGGSQGTINRHVKSVVKTAFGVKPYQHPHAFQLRNGSKTVGEDGQPITGGAFRNSMTRDRVGLAHYVMKSRAEYIEKSYRGTGQSNFKDDAFWDAIEKHTNHTTCTDLVGYDP